VVSTLDPVKRLEIAGYVRKVATERRQSNANPEDVPECLPGTRWRLAFSTDSGGSGSGGDLPPDATVVLDFDSGSSSRTMKYGLEFGKRTLGLSNLIAQSSWSYDATRNALSFVYEKVTADAFGMKNVGVGLFGMLKGRAATIETAYFDGNYWIENVYSAADGQQGHQSYNVYVRED
jgi:hypothetical protein